MGTKGSKYDVSEVDEKDLIPNIYENLADFEDREDIILSLTQKEQRERQLQKLDRDTLIKEIIKLEKK